MAFISGVGLLVLSFGVLWSLVPGKGGESKSYLPGALEPLAAAAITGGIGVSLILIIIGLSR